MMLYEFKFSRELKRVGFTEGSLTYIEVSVV